MIVIVTPGFKSYSRYYQVCDCGPMSKFFLLLQSGDKEYLSAGVVLRTR